MTAGNCGDVQRKKQRQKGTAYRDMNVFILSRIMSYKFDTKRRTTETKEHYRHVGEIFYISVDIAVVAQNNSSTQF